MEAAGIEPTSEESNQPASTSLVRYLISVQRTPADRVPMNQPQFVFRALTGCAGAAADLSSPGPDPIGVVRSMSLLKQRVLD